MSSWTEASALQAFDRAVGALRQFQQRELSERALRSHLGRLRHLRHSPKQYTTCAYRGCSLGNPRLSHVLAKAAAIGPIAEDGHVRSPRLADAGVSVEPVGWSNASTFRGYCEKHEDLFHDFETVKQLSITEHYILQAMRSAAREERRLQTYVDYLERVLEEYDRMGGSSPEAGRPLIADVVDPLQALHSFATIQWSRLTAIHNDLIQALGSTCLPAWIRQWSDPQPPDVGFSANTVLNRSDGDSVVVVVTSFYNAGARLTIVASSRDDAMNVQLYSEQFAGTLPQRDSLVRAWLRGTDHWFARPSWWDNLPQAESQAIQRDLFLIH